MTEFADPSRGTPEQPPNSLPEFMQRFDGTQPKIGQEENERAVERLTELAGDTLLANPGQVMRMNSEEWGDRVLTIGLEPLTTLHDVDVISGRVSVAYNDNRPSAVCVTLDFLRLDRRSRVTYRTVVGEGVVRYYTDNLAERRDREAYDREEMGPEKQVVERDANEDLERLLGVNGCSVSQQEVEGLGQMLAEMRPEGGIVQ